MQHLASALAEGNATKAPILPHYGELIFGLVVSSAFTLVLVPVAYHLLPAQRVTKAD